MISRGKKIVDLCKKSVATNLLLEQNQFEIFDIENLPLQIVDDNLNISVAPLLQLSETFAVVNHQILNETTEDGNIGITTLTPLELDNFVEEEGVLIVNNFAIDQVQSENDPDDVRDIDYVPANSDSSNSSQDKEIVNNNDGLADEQNQDSLENEANDNIAEQPLTKKGNLRKRRKFSVPLKERKRQKVDNLKLKHPILPPCNLENCRQKCTSKINELRRNSINSQFWNLSWEERRSFILNNSSAVPNKNPSALTKRKQSFKLSFTDETRQRHGVCKPFFLTTLGFKKSNDWVVNSVLSKTDMEKIQPSTDGRGKQSSANKIDRKKIDGHIESYNPCISHYRREHAPNLRYLPSDITVVSMHQDFLEKYPNIACSYDLYRKAIKEKKISFSKLGHEECEQCEEFQLHNKEHTKDNLDENCQCCKSWSKHIERAKNAREAYRSFSENIIDHENICVSADLQKVIMLPRIDTFKRVVFTKRIVVYNESFVPLGKKSKAAPFAVLWHEGISGRSKEDIISTFYAFLIKNRDKKNITLWLDNCSSQNKNWALFTFFVYIINSNEIEAEYINVHYFEPGHTFMSADHFHHQVELALKHQRKTYDFSDFVAAVKSTNKSKGEVHEMHFSDFYEWKDCTSLYKVNKLKPRPYLSDMVNIKAERGKHTLKYRNDFSDNYTDMDFLNKKSIKSIAKPKAKEDFCGVDESKKISILENLGSIMPENRKIFWENLPVRLENS